MGYGCDPLSNAATRTLSHAEAIGFARQCGGLENRMRAEMSIESGDFL
jgi:hypothetical protein